MRLSWTIVPLVLAFAPLISADDKPPPAEKPAQSPALLLEDNGDDLLPKLTNPTGCPGEGHVEKEAPFSGASCLRIVPMQRYEPRIPGWEFLIRETPKAGEFRYLRFA